MTHGSAEFASTNWLVVFAAADSGNLPAREELARTYWFPLYALARRNGHSREESEEAVQVLLSRLINGEKLSSIEPQGGHFRDFLRVSLTNQLISLYRSETTLSRRPVGGFVFFDGLDPEARLTLEPSDTRTPEQAFDRLCARALLDSAARQLEREFEPAQRDLFAHLIAHLEGDPRATAHAEAARRFGLAEGTLKNKAVAFRVRFRQVFRQHVAATLREPTAEDIEREIQHLRDALVR